MGMKAFLELGHQLYWERHRKTCIKQASVVRILESPGFSCGEYVNEGAGLDCPP